MRYGLYGIYGVYNFGCEAIVRGTYRYLKSMDPLCEIIYCSYDYNNDRKILSDLNIEVLDIPIRMRLVKRIVNKIFSFINLNSRLLLFDANAVLNRIDTIVSIGGDIYTIPEISRKKKKYTYYNPTVDFCNRAKKRGKAVIAYGASMGPWGDNQDAVDYYVRNIRKYDNIICREQKTINYLKSVNVTNTLLLPDPAFFVEDSECKEKVKTKDCIGVNLSPLSLSEIYGHVSDKMVLEFAMLCEKMVEKFEEKLLFIPHVISKNPMDNDEQFLAEIRNHMRPIYREKVMLADTTGGFIGIKRQLRSCCFVVAARMHCAINAVSESVPAIFLSYSQKSKGMAEYIYGEEKWLIDLKDIGSDLLPTMEKMMRIWPEESIRLEKRVQQIRQGYKKMGEKIRLN